MEDWVRQSMPTLLLGLVMLVFFFARKGARADITEDVEKKQDKRHEQNSEKLDRLNEGMGAVLISQATQTAQINAVRESQAQHERNQTAAFNAQRETIHSLEGRVGSLEARFAELDRFVRERDR